MRCRPSRQVAYTTASQVSNRLSPTPPHFAASPLELGRSSKAQFACGMLLPLFS